jgi:tetratricopeptide (TPR) repeat protein
VHLATRDRAREAVRLAESDPQEAIRLARAAARDATARGELGSAAIAERALGLAQLQLQRMDVALEHLRRAVRLAQLAGAGKVAGAARMTLAGALNRNGQPGAALREIDRARAVLTGPDLARAAAQRGAILHQIGRLDEALDSYRESLPGLRRARDTVWLQRTLANRGVLHTQRQEFAAAADDLHEAEELCRDGRLELSLGYVHQNLGYVHACRGDAPTALAYFDRAEARFRRLGSPLGELLVDRAELLLSVRLIAEARQAAEEAIEALERDGQGLTLPEARLVLSRAALLDGYVPEATRHATAAVVEFGRQRRAEWAALARIVRLSCELAAAHPRAGTAHVARLATTVAECWPAAAVYARLTAARLAVHRGRREQARRLLAEAARSRAHGPVTDRALAWHAEAMLRSLADDRPAALRAARAGLRVLDDHVAALGATDLRASAAGHRTELAALGLRIAVDSGRAERVFRWAELGRASHLLHPPVRPDPDPALAALVAQLRSVVRQIQESRRAGRVDTRLRHRQVALERAVRDHQRSRNADGVRQMIRPPSAQQVGAALGGAALLEFVQCDGMLYAVTVAGGRVRLRRLGPFATIAGWVDRLQFALRALSRHRADPASRAAAHTLLRHVADELSAALLGAVPEVDDQPLAVVPTGCLQSVPWAVLPACAGRPVCVSPSAALLCAARADGEPVGPAIVAAGPGLAGGRDEAATIAALYRVEPLLDASADVDKVTAALDGARIAHLAAHGTLRADNPLFSAIHLADGPLMVHDLERLARGPHSVVLAACDAGQSVVRAGDEIMGFAATLLASGTRQLIAPVVTIPDVETAPVMAAFHGNLLAGEKPAAALARAQRQVPTEFIPAASFVCLGNGFLDPN